MSSNPPKPPSKPTTYFPIKELSTWTSRWTIQARVIEKTPLNQFKRVDGQSSSVGNINIMDKKGDSIRAVFWGEAAEKWLPLLEEGKVYSFQNGRVQIANKRFNTSPHQYELVFEKDADIQELPADDQQQDVVAIPMHRKTNITKLRDIKNSVRALPFMVDLCVVLSWLAPNYDSFSRPDGTESQRRQAAVRDDTGHEMSITFWGDLAKNDELEQAYEHRSDDSPVIIVMQNVQIKDYRGRSGSTMRGSYVLVNPTDDEESNDLKEWYKNEGKHSEFESLTEGGAQFSQGSSGNQQPAQFCTLAEAFEKLQVLPCLGAQDAGESVIVIAEPMKLMYANRAGEMTLSFPGCPRCNRKLQPGTDDDSSSYHCSNCDKAIDNPIEKYMFALSLADSSGARFVGRCFNDQGQIILGRSAEELLKWIPHKSTITDISMEAKQLLEYTALWKRFRFRIRLKKDLFGGEERKNVAVTFVEPLNYATDARRMLNNIAEKLPGYVPFQSLKKRPQPPSGVATTQSDQDGNSENEEEKQEQRRKRARLEDKSDEARETDENDENDENVKNEESSVIKSEGVKVKTMSDGILQEEKHNSPCDGMEDAQRVEY